MKSIIVAATLALLTVSLAGCTTGPLAASDCWKHVEVSAPTTEASKAASHDFTANTQTAYADMGFDGTHWPQLDGHELVVLDHGANAAFEATKDLFEERTGATVIQIAANDAGSALQQALDDKQSGGTAFDVLYGVDNVLMTKAQEGDLFDPYTPLLGDRVAEEHRFVPANGGWLATPVDYGFIAINGDPRHDVSLSGFDDLVNQANSFVTMDPRFSSPGLGFLAATVAAFGEECYLGYWQELFDGGVTVTQGWTEGYVNEFTGGYGQWETGFTGESTIVTSYSTSPAYEMYYGYDVQNPVLTAPQTTFKQVQTAGILRGADRAVSEAWIEFLLTDEVQSLAAGYNAIYPVVNNDVTTASVTDVYQGRDPAPGTFTPAQLTSAELGEGVDQWVADWVSLFEANKA